MKSLWIAPLLLVATALPAHAREAASPAMVAVEAQAAALTRNSYVWNEVPGAVGPLRVVVSIADQRAYVYRGETMIAAASVSTGKDGKETPAGEYPILQKAVKHKSNLYNSAPMPYMQRLTWDGIALHAGNNPGFPDSHGCVRLPAAFAKRLFAATEVGTTVSVVEEPIMLQSDLSPIEDPALTTAETAQIAALGGR
ncbi:L,D-transpeptidase family protein [Sphingomonas aracearum]|uniref:L,D-TPase catalytic domain-containing protein n=1 Tax=Sphingomonas aracearum TaxID=2283317 RepID=A0A369VT23_9SPHN|nr:L,D-transpeptidase family protein [Sphingomonas aracearum]RDE05556.1 hypothetical protein DVW87_09985 [Sphingomonas aracearum]